MGGASSVLPGQAEVDGRRRREMLAGTPIASMLATDDLAAFAATFQPIIIAPNSMMTLSTGDFLVVGEGEVQVMVVEPGIDQYTGDNRVVLCTKRRSDIIWVPAVNRLVSELSLERRRRKSVLERKHKPLYRLVDNTSIKTFQGATLLKLDRAKYQKFIKDRHAYIDLVSLQKVMESNIVDYLRQIKFLSKVPPAKLNVLSSMCNYEFKKKGQEVCREGEVGAEVYLVVDGKLAVETVKDGQVLKLAELTPGQNFGELGAMFRMRRIATVRAVEPSLLVSIKRHDFRSFLSINAEVQAAVEAELKYNLLHKIAAMGHLLFPEYLLRDPNTTAGPGLPPLSGLVQLLDLDSDMVVFCEGQPATDFMLLVEGGVQVTFGKERLRAPEQVRDGEAFGNLARLDLDEPERYTAVTQRPSVFLRIPRMAFLRYLGANPPIFAALELRNLRRSMPLHRLLLVPSAKEAFYAHLQSEYSAENLDFYDEVTELEGLTSSSEVSQRAVELWAHYIEQGAIKQINISDAQRNRIKRALSMGGPVATTALVESLGEAKREVLLLMQKDNYSRFKDKEEFRSLLSAVDVAIPSACGRLLNEPNTPAKSSSGMSQTTPLLAATRRGSMLNLGIDSAMRAAPSAE